MKRVVPTSPFEDVKKAARIRALNRTAPRQEPTTPEGKAKRRRISRARRKNDALNQPVVFRGYGNRTGG